MINKITALNFGLFGASEIDDDEPEKVKNAIATVPTTHLVGTGEEIDGLDVLDPEDIATSRIKLLQPTSDEVANGQAAGTWLNTLSGENYGDSFEFTVIGLWKSRTYFSEDRSEGTICRSPDGFTSVEGHKCQIECPHDANKWIDRSPPACNEQYNFLILPVSEGGIPEGFPSIVTMMKSSFKTGKKLYTLVVAARSPMWFWTYELSASQESNNRGTYYVADARKVITDGKTVATSDEVRQIAETFRRMKTEGRIQVAGEEEAQATPQPVDESLSDNQRKQIIEAINDSKLSHQDFEQMCCDEFGKKFDELTRSEGAELLNNLLPQEPIVQEPVTSETPF